MRQRSSAGGKPAKARRGKAASRKRRVVVKPPAAAGLQGTIDRLTRERDEALEQQTATSEVLQVISSCAGELEPVFAAMLGRATRICEAEFGNFFLLDGETFRALAWHGEATYVGNWQRQPLAIKTDEPHIPLARLVETKQRVHVADLREDVAYKAGFAPLVALVDKGGARTLLIVPMLKEHTLIGAMAIYRQEVRPFTVKQIALVENFAAQAVIAIENARLLSELRESLEQQTATAKVLDVISRSAFDLPAVFETVAESSVRLCGADRAFIFRFDGELLRMAASYNAAPDFVEWVARHPIQPGRHSGSARAALERRTIHIPDVRADADYVYGAKDVEAIRTILGVPILKGDELLGVMMIYHLEVRPFTDKQIALVETFADQAAIAIENVRLFEAEQQRSSELAESLEQQTATSEVLRVISSSPGELEPVFEIILEDATRICEAKFGIMQLIEGDGLRAVALHDVPSAYAEAMGHDPIFRPPVGHPLDRVISTKRVVHIPDMRTEQKLRGRIVELAGARTLLTVPMLKENALIGVISIYRQEVRPFADKQIELVKNFAAQAVIAIENARLLGELRQRTNDLTERTTDLTETLEQQRATSQVLQVISSSPGDLGPVFASVLENAARVCEAKFGNIFRLDHDAIRPVAALAEPEALVEFFQHGPHRPHEDDPLMRVARTKQSIHVLDFTKELAYIERNPLAVAAAELGGIRTLLVVPMLKGDVLIGAIALYRQEVRRFSDKQIALVTNFASQAVIAIENARLLKELRERTEEVEKLNQHLEQRVADQVGEIDRMSRLRRFLPPQVADLIVASGTEKQLESHRSEITALFCDLRGFTGFTESADAEDVMALLRDYHAALGELVIKYSGTLERYAGDGVMVVFNDPVPVENPALQAVLMALEVRDAIGALTATWSRLGHEIGFGIGIAHGFATLGTIGFEGRFDYAAIGTVSNVASRLCDEARSEQILISPRVLTKVENAVTVEPVGEFELKGIRRPLTAYNVVATKSKN